MTQTAIPTVNDLTLFDVLERNVQAFPDHPALIVDNGPDAPHDDVVTFRQLKERVDRVAGGLEQLGLGHGDRLAVLSLNSQSFVELYFAAARQGCIVVPVNWRLQANEIDLLLQRTQPRALFFDATHRETASQLLRTESLQMRVLLDPPAAGSDIEVQTDEITAEVIAWSTLDLAPGPRPAVSSSDPLAIIATAAVDVIPRGAMLSHGNLVAANLAEIASLSLSAQDRSLLALPLFHIAALGHFLAFFHVGGCSVVTPRFDAARAVDLIEQHEINHLSDFPPVLAMLLDAAAESPSENPLASLEIVTGLDAPDTMKRLHEETGATFWTGFGQAETTGFVTLQNAREELGCAGLACDLSRVELVDEFDRPVPVGQEGEIVVRGPLVFLGYDGQEDVTDYTFRNGWHHTGDIGRFDERGRLYYVKRKAEKELIKPGGENVYPAEVEAVLVTIPGVEAACVIGVPDPKWGEGILAILETTSAFNLDLGGVRAFVGERIAGFKRPHRIETVDSLPRLEDRSVDREAVRGAWS